MWAPHLRNAWELPLGAVRRRAGPPRRLAGAAVRAARQALGGVSGRAAAVATLRAAARGYRGWIAAYDVLDAADRARICAWVASLTRPPLISVVMPVYDPPEAFLRCALDSVRAQLYPHWQLCIADDCSSAPHVARVLLEYARADGRIKVVRLPRNGHICAASNAALALACGSHVALLDHDDELAEAALAAVARAISDRPDLGLIYSDEDKIDAAGRRSDPYFKGNFDLDLLRAQNMVSHLGVYNRDLVLRLGGFRRGLEGSQDHDLALRVVEQLRTDQIHHIPHVLYHWRMTSGSTAVAGAAKPYARTAAARAVTDHLRRCGEPAEVIPARIPDFLHVRYALPQPAPSVAVVVLLPSSADRACRQLQQLLRARNMTDGLRTVTWTWVHDAVPTLTTALTAQLAPHGTPHRRIAVPPAASTAARVNAGVAATTADCVAVVAADVVPNSPKWVADLLAHAYRPGVGMVGARLVSRLGTIRSAGLLLGVGGLAAPALSGRCAGFSYFGRGSLTQRTSALPMGCWMVRRAAYLAAGGLSPTFGKHATLDLCLALADLGLRHLLVAEVSAVAPADAPRAEKDSGAERLRARWAGALDQDASYNPNLTSTAGCFDLAFPPRHQPLGRSFTG